MPRSVNSVASKARRKKILKQAKGYFGRRKNVFTVAKNAVEKAKDYIAKGDVFQLVLSQKFNTSVHHSSLDLYRSLRIVNPSPFMAFYDFGDWQLIGSSP